MGEVFRLIPEFRILRLIFHIIIGFPVHIQCLKATDHLNLKL